MTIGGGRDLLTTKPAARRTWPHLRPERPFLTLLVAYALSIAGSLLLSAIIATIVPAAKSPDFSWFVGRGILTVFLLTVFSPLVETLILAATTTVLLRFVNPKFAILLSSLGWALAHSYQAPIWGLVIWWPFIIFTTLFVVWKERSLAWGLFMPFAAHFLQNLLTAVALGYPGLLPRF